MKPLCCRAHTSKDAARAPPTAAAVSEGSSASMCTPRGNVHHGIDDVLSWRSGYIMYRLPASASIIDLLADDSYGMM
jgi:hypothetical protein